MHCTDYLYDDILPEVNPEDPFDPPMEELYPEELSGNFQLFENNSVTTPTHPPISEVTSSKEEEPSEEPSIIPDKKNRIAEKRKEARSRFANKAKVIVKERREETKQKQQIRNRLSAQRSRDRKRKELEVLREENRSLRETNALLELQSAETARALQLHELTLERLPEDFQEVYNKTRMQLQNGFQQSRRRSRISSPLLFATALVGCLCVIACVCPLMFTDIPPQTSAISPSRLLVSSNSQIYAKPARSGSLQFLHDARDWFLDRNSGKMRSLPSLPSPKSDQLALYYNPITYAEDAFTSNDIDEEVTSILTDRAYIYSGSEKAGLKESDEPLPFLHLLIKDKNIRFVLRDGTVVPNPVQEDSTLHIGCKVFDVSRENSAVHQADFLQRCNR